MPELCRGTYHQLFAPGVTRPLHACGHMQLRAREGSCKSNNFQVCEPSKTAVKPHSIILVVDQLTSSVVTDVWELVRAIEVDHMTELVDSDLVNVTLVSIFQMCSKIILNEKRK